MMKDNSKKCALSYPNIELSSQYECTDAFGGLSSQVLIIDMPEGETLPMDTLIALSKKHHIPIQNIIIRGLKKGAKL